MPFVSIANNGIPEINSCTLQTINNRTPAMAIKLMVFLDLMKKPTYIIKTPQIADKIIAFILLYKSVYELYFVNIKPTLSENILKNGAGYIPTIMINVVNIANTNICIPLISTKEDNELSSSP